MEDDLREVAVESLEATTRTDPSPVRGVVIGMLVGADAAGAPLVVFPGNPVDGPVAAVSAQALDASAVGRQVALMFVEGDRRQPIVVGLIEHLASEGARFRSDASVSAAVRPRDAVGAPETANDARRVCIEAADEIVLRCGRSSITLTRAGKVIIRGAYVSSKSSGANRIRGGSIHLN